MRTIRDDLAGWKLNRVVWVADSGFNSVANRAYLQRGGGHYVLAERLRRGSLEARAALSRAARYRRLAGNLEVKEVRLGDGARAQRFVLCHNPEAAARDEQVRGNLIAYLEGQIAGSDAWSRSRRDELVGALRLRPVFHFREDRIRAHVQLCWLALLLIRVVENATGESWRVVRDELERMHLVTLETGEGRIAKRSLTTPGQRQILAALELPEPPAFSDFEVTETPA